MEEHKNVFIEQLSDDDALFTKLQKQTLEEVQRMSGKVWTDFNAHDPGVTLSETVNYALTELDYKLGFNVFDYLSDSDCKLDLNRIGLFLPVNAYYTFPVTEDDYRRMLLANIDDLDFAEVHCDTDTGAYTVGVIMSPFGERDVNEMVRMVKVEFNKRRNLCEWLEKVELIQPEELDFVAELEIEPGEDATDVLVGIFWCIMRYLAGNVDICMPDGNTNDTVSPEKWMEGEQHILRVNIPAQEFTEHELYRNLCKVKGVAHFYTCYLVKDNVPQTRFGVKNSLHIPTSDEEFERICIRCGRQVMSVDCERFYERLRGLYFMNRQNVYLMKQNEDKSCWKQPESVWRNIFDHYPIANDFPKCYRFNPQGEVVSDFENYIRLFDWIISNGLKELEILPKLLSLKESKMDALLNRSQLNLKNRYLDFLDDLYGTDSNPAWLSEENNYGETTAGTVRRRTRFIANADVLNASRAKARNLYSTDKDVSTVKMYFCLLLGLEYDDEKTISNVLPEHNLRLVECINKKNKNRINSLGITDRIDSLLIEEKMLSPDNVIPVNFVVLSEDKEGKIREYKKMREELPFFNENIVTGDLFRGGTRLKNYKIVKTSDDMFMLMYRHQERGGWTNLGKDSDKNRLEMLANILRRFLRELNRKSETVYVVEPVLANRTRAFELLLVLPAWTYRFHSRRFRDRCRELMRSIVPAHLTGKLYWLEEKEMRQFEICYHQLVRTFSDSRLEDYRGILMEAIYELVSKAEEIQSLDDQD